MRRFTAFLVALLLAALPVIAVNAATSSKTRDFVLVLDDSGSMDGEPTRQLVLAAQQTVRSIFDQSDNARIAVVRYSSSAAVLSDFKTKQDEAELISAISGMYSSGVTEMVGALNLANDLISASAAEERVVIFMSDGMPTDSDGDVTRNVDPIYAAASELHNFATVYTIGFFQKLSSGNTRFAEDVLRNIASDNTKFFNVEGAQDFQIAFEDIVGEVVLDKKRIIVYIACPVDVQVTHQGETLDKYNTRTSFGAMQFEGADNEKKTLRLDADYEYIIEMLGTGVGVMNYTITYPDADGNYSDERAFLNIPITSGVSIVSSTAQAASTILAIDYDGDNVIDKTLSAMPGKPYDADKIQPIPGDLFDVSESEYSKNNNSAVCAAKANDGDFATAWNAGNTHSGMGEWITFTLRDGSERTFNGFYLYNGYNLVAADKDHWEINARVKRVSVYCDDVFVESFDVLDTRAEQVFEFAAPPTGNGLKIVIDDVYVGDKHPFICISELIFY